MLFSKNKINENKIKKLFLCIFYFKLNRFLRLKKVIFIWFKVFIGVIFVFELGFNFWDFLCGCSFIIESDLEFVLWVM